MSVLTRRELIAGSIAGATSLAYRGVEVPKVNRKRVLRFGHLTDIHVQPEGGAAKGMEAALLHMQSQKDKVEFLVTGGDQIMDSFGADAARTEAQWKIWKDVLKANLKVPVAHCIGNHDVWGWPTEAKTEAKRGKVWAQEVMALSAPYYSFNRAGWHWIILDGTFPAGAGYTAKLDDEQFEWLKGDLEGVDPKVPVIVVSHEPLFCACSFLDGENEKTGNWVVPGSWMHIDFRRIKNLFAKHPNVKLAISGHMHMVDRVDYLGVSYLCNGAVCGSWWSGNYHEFAPGYAVIDLFDDGTFAHEFVTWGWQKDA